jgi:signal transduction histidine kinase
MSHRILPHLYETVAREAFFGIVVFDSTGECLYINPRANYMLGTDEPTLKDLEPRSLRANSRGFTPELLKHDGLYQDIVVQSAANHSFVAKVGVKHLEVDGVSAHLIMLEDVTLQKKMQRDITAKQNEIKAAFEELLNQNRQLKELDHAKDRFIALTTHELRTPLSAMVASAEILKLKLYDTPEQMQEFIDMIYEQGGHLQELVNDILDFAKIQAGKMDFYIEQTDVEPLIHGIVKNFEGMAETYHVTFDYQKPAAPLTCYFDEVRLRQIISNIVNNAIKYNRPQGQVKVYFEETPECVKVCVQDSGNGIPADQFAKVFNEFETIGHVAQHHKGTGLGMPISRKLAEGMGGKLLLKSTEGVGSTFWVEIPKEKILEATLYKSRSGDFAA